MFIEITVIILYCNNKTIFNPYSAKGLGDRLYATLHKMLGEIGNSFCLFLKSQNSPLYTSGSHKYIPQQGQSLHIWTTSLSTTGSYKNRYAIQFFWMACISRFALAILSGETELALGNIRVNYFSLTPKNIGTICVWLWSSLNVSNTISWLSEEIQIMRMRNPNNAN